VAWAWAPADPLHDQPYAPPAWTIDAVLQSFINYPGTPWGDPATVLDQLSQRYPGKPLFVEASAAGPPAEKAAWLTRLGDAVKSDREVYALLYHEGGPGLNLTPADVKSWSVESDPASLAAMRNALAGVGGGGPAGSARADTTRSNLGKCCHRRAGTVMSGAHSGTWPIKGDGSQSLPGGDTGSRPTGGKIPRSAVGAKQRRTAGDRKEGANPSVPHRGPHVTLRSIHIRPTGASPHYQTGEFLAKWSFVVDFGRQAATPRDDRCRFSKLSPWRNARETARV
jgi:hypothetical protein